MRTGVFFAGTDKEGNEQPTRWICSPIQILAMTRDPKSDAWGRLLEWRHSESVRRSWAMPLELLQSGGAEARGELARQGLSMAPDERLGNSLPRFSRCLSTAGHDAPHRLGWHGSVR